MANDRDVAPAGTLRRQEQARQAQARPFVFDDEDDDEANDDDASLDPERPSRLDELAERTRKGLPLFAC